MPLMTSGLDTYGTLDYGQVHLHICWGPLHRDGEAAWLCPKDRCQYGTVAETAVMVLCRSCLIRMTRPSSHDKPT